MRVVMPLCEFNYEGREIKFTNNYSLESFDHNKEIPDNRTGLSELDISQISLENWALVVSNPNEYYRSEINLLLIAFRIYAQSNAFIKWRFCKENPSYSARLNERFRNLTMTSSVNITEQDLNLVKDGFLKVLEMYKISDRTKNALYFIWRGLHAEKHIDAYIFLVCAIEALFSNETSEDVTKTLIKRTQKFLSGIEGFGGDQIKRIYKIRSDIVHGRIAHTDKKDLIQREQNIKDLAKLELLVFSCIKRILEEKVYLKYTDTSIKEKFLNDLMNN
ncbi:MAG: hypothetical protein KAS99_02415 [Candidatus Omnitrophica bacterium]|nr:hypothetical protein [Candidatus Omnitrophota bacterium]